MPTNKQLEDELTDLRNQVAVLEYDAKQAREQALAVVNPVDPYAQAAEAVKREKEAHAKWKASRGYGTQPAIQLSIPNQLEEYQRAVASALAAEKQQHEAWKARTRANAAEHAERAAAGEHQPDQFQRAASDAARQRQIERSRIAPIVEEALAPVGDLR